MQIERLLSDASGLAPGTSRHQQHIRLAELLNDRYGPGSITVKGVAKWAERGRIPGNWLMKVAGLPKKPLNLANYA